MNTEIAVAAPDLDEAAELALAHRIARLFARVERQFSRFRDDSELGELNRAIAPITVSPDMLEILLRARAHVRASEGVFDPAVGAALAAAGYDRSFAPGALDRTSIDGAALPAHFADVWIEEPTRRVFRPPHVQLDFGGFLKGRTVDLAAALAPGGCVMVDAGGDARLVGDGPEGEGWLVDVEDPTDPQAVVATLRLRDRAIATSAANRRHWQVGDTTAHHLIDPRRGAPAVTDLAQVTVVAETTEQADVLAKVAFVLGEEDGTAWLRGRPGIGAVLVRRDGTTKIVGELEVAHA
ncbi:MAG TPA: FAD:protein FMN transferase [Kofleriaceae bacterium]|nr:FAD:protein FMN transferase [Kofleriaceae bacterium]